MMAYSRCDFLLHGLESTHTELLEARDGAGSSIPRSPWTSNIVPLTVLLSFTSSTLTEQSNSEDVSFCLPGRA